MHMVNGCLKANCKEYGWHDTHSTKFQEEWINNRANFCLPDSHPFVFHKAILASAGTTFHQSAAKPNPSDDSSDSITFSRATMESKIADVEKNSTDPNAGTMCQMISSMFLN
jgi:hypothetical protein